MAKDRTLSPKLDRTIYNLRVSGVSERRIYEGLRDVLAEPPSYRDIRASLTKEGVRFKSEAAAARRAGRYENPPGGDRPMNESQYLDRQAETRKYDRSPDAQDVLVQNYILGQLARQGVDPDTLDDRALAERLENIYNDEGSS